MPKIVIYLFKSVLLFAVYFAAAKVGLSLDAVSGFAALIWAPTGIALAALLILGIKYWPAIFLAAYFVNFSTGAPLLVAAGMGVGNTLEAVVAAYLLKKFINIETFLDQLKDVFYLIFLAALFSTAISATIGVASLYLGGIVPVSKLVDTWTAWWMGDMLGDLIVLPLIIAWSGLSLPAFLINPTLELLALLVIVPSA
ncbi:MAG: MASE1 domain-containing protein, partial [bacterium]|nr:MASE1 domain-containing protein [bacterium]